MHRFFDVAFDDRGLAGSHCIVLTAGAHGVQHRGTIHFVNPKQLPRTWVEMLPACSKIVLFGTTRLPMQSNCAITGALLSNASRALCKISVDVIQKLRLGSRLRMLLMLKVAIFDPGRVPDGTLSIFCDRERWPL